MLIGNIVTLEELEELLSDASNKYKLRLPKLRYEANQVEQEFVNMNRYRSDENDHRYVTGEAREKYYEVQKIREEYKFVNETLEVFAEALKDLRTYEERHRIKGLFVKKSENTFELTPKYLQLFAAYDDDVEEHKQNRLQKIQEEKDALIKERIALESKKEAEFVSALEKSVTGSNEKKVTTESKERAEETVQSMNEDKKEDNKDIKEDKKKEEVKETKEDKSKAPKFRVPDKK